MLVSYPLSTGVELAAFSSFGTAVKYLSHLAGVLFPGLVTNTVLSLLPPKESGGPLFLVRAFLLIDRETRSGL